MADQLRASIREWEKKRISSERRITWKEASIESWQRTNTAMKKSLEASFRLLKSNGYDPLKLVEDLKLLESAIPVDSGVPRRIPTQPFNLETFGFLQYPWKTDDGIKLDTALAKAKLVSLETQMDNLTQLQQRQELIYGALKNMKEKSRSIYMKRRGENRPREEKTKSLCQERGETFSRIIYRTGSCQ
ncbi:hypothetical protein ScPMuIL_016470 [Solemya velum]